MSLNANEKLQSEVEKTVGEIEKNFLRKMQGRMFRCSAECCDDALSSSERMRRCLQDCRQDVEDADKFIQGEFSKFQDRLNRCHMACYDKIQDKMGTNPTQRDTEKFKKELENCALDCAESHLLLLSQIYKRTKEFLSKSNVETL